MTEHPFDPVEAFWDAIFSRDPQQIRAVFDPLDEGTQQSVLAHLARMVSEKNWHPEQVKSARAALETLKGVRPGEDRPAPAPAPGAGEAGLPAKKPARRRHGSKMGRD